MAILHLIFPAKSLKSILLHSHISIQTKHVSSAQQPHMTVAMALDSAAVEHYYVNYKEICKISKENRIVR